jgi:hypothetical protein
VVFSEHGNDVSKKKERHSLISCTPSPSDEQKIPQLLGINSNNDQNLPTVVLLGGRLTFRQKNITFCLLHPWLINLSFNVIN